MLILPAFLFPDSLCGWSICEEPNRLDGQGVPPVEAGERGGGIVGDVREIVADLLAGHDLGVAGLLDGDVGV